MGVLYSYRWKRNQNNNYKYISPLLCENRLDILRTIYVLIVLPTNNNSSGHVFPPQIIFQYFVKPSLSVVCPLDIFSRRWRSPSSLPNLFWQRPYLSMLNRSMRLAVPSHRALLLIPTHRAFRYRFLLFPSNFDTLLPSHSSLWSWVTRVFGDVSVSHACVWSIHFILDTSTSKLVGKCERKNRSRIWELSFRCFSVEANKLGLHLNASWS